MDNNNYELKYKYAWNWFKHHAVQRYSSFYYYLLIVGALSYGYIQVNCSNKIRLFISLFGMIVSVAFLFIEKRNTDLVECGRKALDALEKDQACVLSNSFIRCRDIKSSKKLCLTHTFWFRSMITFIFVISLIAFMEIILGKWDKILQNLGSCSTWIIILIAVIGLIVMGLIAFSSRDRINNIKTPNDCWGKECE